jgi:hypothetical protein
MTLIIGFACMALLAGGSAQTLAFDETPNSGGVKLNPEGVLALLDVMDAVASLHPELEEKTELYGKMPDADKEAMFADVRQRNEQDKALRSAIQTMLDTKTYQIYFGRFRNVTPDLVQDLLLDLPYGKRSGPGDIGNMLRELLRKRTSVRAALDRLLTEVDMHWVYETAESWVPKEDREPPTLYLIYDSNAGSFTAGGIPFFNIYTDLPLDTLSSDEDGSTLLEAQGIMAHELQHVLARPHLYPSMSRGRTWQQVWVDRITRGLVSEGVAIHCNPPAGIKKEIYEDELVLSALTSRLNDALIALSKDEMTEEEVQDWHSANFFSFAEDLLKQHLEKRYSGDELEAKLRKHMSLRPDLEHTLGWWMVSRVSGGGERPDAAISLLSDPYSVYMLYNNACVEAGEGLKISPAALEYLQSIHETSETSGGGD